MTNFYTIPVDFKLPGSFAEFNSSKAQRGLNGFPHKILLLGHKTTIGTAKIGTPIIVNNGAQAQLFGNNSMLSTMLDAVFMVNPYQEIYALPLAEPATGTQIIWQINLEGTSVTQATVTTLYVYGKKIAITVKGTATEIAVQMQTALQADKNLSIENVTVDGNIVRFSYLHKGSSFDTEIPQFNIADNESNPIGFVAAITKHQAGSGMVDSTIVGAALGDVWWSEIVNPFSRDLALLNILATIFKNNVMEAHDKNLAFNF